MSNNGSARTQSGPDGWASILPLSIQLPVGYHPLDIRQLTERLCQELDEIRLLGPHGQQATALTFARRDAASLRAALALRWHDAPAHTPQPSAGTRDSAPPVGPITAG